MSTSHPPLHRKPTRLKDFDYSVPGGYFVTMVTHGRENLFGFIENGQMTLSPAGKLVQRVWFELPAHYANVCVYEEDFVVMPNHVHGILVLIDGAVLEHPCALTEIIRGFKSFSALRMNRQRGISGRPVWQRSFYEHILRDEGEWDRARKYILQNPQQWQEDQENINRSTHMKP